LKESQKIVFDIKQALLGKTLQAKLYSNIHAYLMMHNVMYNPSPFLYSQCTDPCDGRYSLPDCLKWIFAGGEEEPGPSQSRKTTKKRRADN
jgi:hypothetical protein